MSTTTTTSRKRTARTVGVGLALLALSGPAQARPVDPGYQHPPFFVPPTAQQVTPTRTVVVHDTSFDWTDAAIGAAATGGLVALLGAGLIATNGGRRRQHASRVAH